MAEVYLALNEGGEMSVPAITEKTGLSRAGVYDVLPFLMASGFVEYRKSGRAAFYKATHPNKILTLLDEKKRQTVLLEDEVKNAVKTLTGTWQLGNNKPGILFFEGLDGLKEALYESLNTTGTIYTFVDNKTVDKYLLQVDAEYVQERLRRGIKKKIIMTDSPEARDYQAKADPQFTEIKLFDAAKYPFVIAVEIYDDEVSYLTVKNDEVISFIIKHAEIARFHKSQFECIWNQL